MDHDVLVFEFDEQAWSHLQLVGAEKDLCTYLFISLLIWIIYFLIVSNKFNVRMPSLPNPASNEIISASVLLWDTAFRLLQAHAIAQTYAIQMYT